MTPEDRAAVGEALLASSADAVVYCGRDGTIGLWSPGAERIFGFTAAEALGRSLDIIIPEAQRARHWTGFDRVMASGQSRYGAGEVLAVPALHRDGHRISVEFTIVPMRDAQPTGGYPKMGTVIEADLWRLGQAPIGSRVRFVQASWDEALDALEELHAWLARAARNIALHRAAGGAA